MLSPRRLVEREGHAGVVQGLADQVAALGWDVGVFLAEDLEELERVSLVRLGFLVKKLGWMGRDEP